MQERFFIGVVSMDRLPTIVLRQKLVLEMAPTELDQQLLDLKRQFVDSDVKIIEQNDLTLDVQVKYRWRNRFYSHDICEGNPALHFVL